MSFNYVFSRSVFAAAQSKYVLNRIDIVTLPVSNRISTSEYVPALAFGRGDVKIFDGRRVRAVIASPAEGHVTCLV